MKKIVIRQAGGPEVLETKEVPDPSPGDNEVLVDLRATGLNWSEVMIRKGDWPMNLTNGYTPGAEGTGVVEAVGARVERIRPGDRVAVFDLLAYTLEEQGTYAEKIVVAEDKVLSLPDHLDFPEAAALPVATLTAYDALINHSPLPDTGTVVVTACTGAVGIAAIQIARRRGLRVIGTTRSETKKAQIAGLGVEVAVGTDPEVLKENIEGLVGAGGVDYVFDPVNGETATQLLSLVNGNGTFVSYGMLNDDHFTVQAPVIFNQVKIHGYVVLKNLEDPQTLQGVWSEILPLIETKEIVVPVHKTFPFDEIRRAHYELETHKHFGKLVLVQ